MKEIIEGASSFEQLVNTYKHKSPYFPDYIYNYSIDNIGSGLSIIRVVFSTLVRHEHEGVWYKRHHFDTFQESYHDKDKQIYNFTKEFLFNVYLDLKFGVIDPNLGIDDVDEIQSDELERLNIK